MSEDDFRHLYEDLTVCRRNLQKDPVTRRKDLEVVNRKNDYLNRVRKDFETIKAAFRARPEEERNKHRASIQKYADAINKLLDSIGTVIQERLDDIANNVAEIQTATNMSDNFDLRTASNMLPLMDDSEKITKQLIDAITLYDSFLNNAGKKLLTNYVLKARLSQGAKLRLQETYDTNDDLVAAIKRHCLVPKSAAAVSAKLNSARQGGRSIEQFGKSIEEMFLDLTIAQSDGSQNSMKILQKANENLAINVFANGLNRPDLRTIVKARNVTSLAEAIRVSLDENQDGQTNHEINHFRFRGRNFRNFGNSRGFRGARYTNRNYVGYRNNNNNNRAENSRQQDSRQNYTNGASTRGYRGNRNFQGRINSNTRGNYPNRGHMAHVMTEEAGEKESTFFRE